MGTSNRNQGEVADSGANTRSVRYGMLMTRFK
jgi:hypothetical protein